MFMLNAHLELLDGKGSDRTALNIGRSTKFADHRTSSSSAIIDKPLLFVLTLLVTQTMSHYNFTDLVIGSYERLQSDFVLKLDRAVQHQTV